MHSDQSELEKHKHPFFQNAGETATCLKTGLLSQPILIKNGIHIYHLLWNKIETLRVWFLMFMPIGTIN